MIFSLPTSCMSNPNTSILPNKPRNPVCQHRLDYQVEVSIKGLSLYQSLKSFLSMGNRNQKFSSCSETSSVSIAWGCTYRKAKQLSHMCRGHNINSYFFFKQTGRELAQNIYKQGKANVQCYTWVVYSETGSPSSSVDQIQY